MRVVTGDALLVAGMFAYDDLGLGGGPGGDFGQRF